MKEEKNLMHNLRNVAPNLFNLSESNEHDFAEEEEKKSQSQKIKSSFCAVDNRANANSKDY